MITVKGLYKSFGNAEVLKDINIHIEKGEKIVIVAVSYTNIDVYKRQILCRRLTSWGRFYTALPPESGA